MGSATLAAVNWQGDAAFQGLLDVSLGSLFFPGVIVGIAIAWKKIRMGIGAFVVMAFFTNYLWNHWLFVVLDGVRSNRFEFQGDAQFQALLNLTSVGTFIGAVVAVILAKAILKTGWGLLTSLVMALAFAILWLHWLVPFWNSLNMNV